MADLDVEGLARRLLSARQDGRPVDPLTDESPDMTVGQAYAVQQRLVELLLEAAPADNVAGYKIGLTSAAMQRMLGVSTPDFGAVLGSTVYTSGTSIALDDFIAPRVEAEIALVLRKPLKGPGVTPQAVVAATAGAAACLEVVDSRIRDWRLRLPDTVADLASAGAAVVSARLVPLDDIDLRLVGMVVTRGGRVVDTGAGAATLGNPLVAAAWLANTLGEIGVELQPGQLILTGALHAAFPFGRGDVVRADFDRLGAVSVRVT